MRQPFLVITEIPDDASIDEEAVRLASKIMGGAVGDWVSVIPIHRTDSVPEGMITRG